ARPFPRDSGSAPSLYRCVRSSRHRVGPDRFADPPHERLASLYLTDRRWVEAGPFGCRLDDLLVEIAKAQSIRDPARDCLTLGTGEMREAYDVGGPSQEVKRNRPRSQRHHACTLLDPEAVHVEHEIVVSRRFLIDAGEALQVVAAPGIG